MEENRPFGILQVCCGYKCSSSGIPVGLWRGCTELKKKEINQDKEEQYERINAVFSKKLTIVHLFQIGTIFSTL